MGFQYDQVKPYRPSGHYDELLAEIDSMSIGVVNIRPRDEELYSDIAEDFSFTPDKSIFLTPHRQADSPYEPRTMRCKMKNFWVTDSDYFASWHCILPDLPKTLKLKKLLSFAEQFLVAGQKEDVWHLFETQRYKLCDAFRIETEQSYLAYMERVAETTGKIPLFPLSRGVIYTEAGTVRTPGRICYYDAQGNLAEGRVYDAGKLIRELRGEPEHTFTQAVAPITVIGTFVSIENSKSHSPRLPEAVVFINLATDLWFPKVVGYLEQGLGKQKEMYDNSELAACHTPRFNHFLQTVRQITLSMGGKWYTEISGEHSRYVHMITDTGIKL